MRTPGSGNTPVFSLTSTFVPQKKQNLASFISVDADASRPGYGTIRILRLPSNTSVPGPSQIANNFGQDADIQNKLVAFTKANSRAVYGNLLTLPVGDGLLYVQPLYAQRKTGAALYPALRYVLVSFGEQVGIGTTLTAALDDVLGIAAPPNEGTGGTGGGTSGGSGGTSGGTVPGDVRSLLQQAEAKFVGGAAGAPVGRPRGLREGPGCGARPGAQGPGRGRQGEPVGEAVPVALREAVTLVVGVPDRLTRPPVRGASSRIVP